MTASFVKKIWHKYSAIFGTSLIHPQYIIRRYQQETIKEAKKYARGSLIDIGCGRMPYRKELESLVDSYTGVDHPKVSQKYKTDRKPEVFADAKKLPFSSNKFDIALLLQVLEHVDQPQEVINEASRVLKPGGIFIISVPFLYPLHDLPYDRGRYTEETLRTFIKKASLGVIKLKMQGNFVEFWLQSLNVFLIKRIDDIISRGFTPFSTIYLFFLIVITPPIVLLTNITVLAFDRLLSAFPKYPNYFPLEFLVVAKKLRLE